MTDKAIEERLTKARIKLQGRNPFFSYLSLYLKFEEQDKLIDGCYSMGVYPDGTCVYNPEWIKTLDDEELIGVLCHEILHLSLLHLVRRRTREPNKWNVAVDLASNSILVKNNFKLPKDGIIPQNDEWQIPKEWQIATFMSKAKQSGNKGLLNGNSLNNKNIKPNKITDISSKTAEEIFDLLPDLPESLKNNVRGRYMKGEGKEGEGHSVGGWDKHNEEERGKEGKGTEADKNALENEWLNRTEEAYVSAKQKGNVPLGLERYIDELKKSQVDWKTLLQKYITASFPSDYSWGRRSRKSMATGIYMPSVIKEKIDVAVGIDTSGSIGEEELSEFMGEMLAIGKAYREKLTMRIMCHDTDVHTDEIITNGTTEQKIKKIKIKGGGGTEHTKLLNHIKNKIRDCKVAIFFTDAYSDIENIKLRDYNFTKIFVISKNGTTDCFKNKKGECFVIKMK